MWLLMGHCLNMPVTYLLGLFQCGPAANFFSTAFKILTTNWECKIKKKISGPF